MSTRSVRLLSATACALALTAAPALAAGHRRGGSPAGPHRGVVLSVGHGAVRLVDGDHRVADVHVRSTRGLRRGEVVAVRGGRAHVIGRVGRVSFYGRVVKSSARGAVIRLADGSTFKLDARRGARAASTVTVNVEGLAPGQAVLVTVDTDAHGNVAVTIGLVPGTTDIGDHEQLASGYVTDDGQDAFAIRAGDGSGLRFLDPQALLAAADGGQCDTVEVTYHADGRRLVADGVRVTGQSTQGSCADGQQGGDEVDGTVTAIAADGSSITVDAGDRGAPQTFPLENPTVLDGIAVGDEVAVTVDDSGTATEVDALDAGGDQGDSGDQTPQDGGGDS